jgi:Ca2+-binding RTX toxin-like protein
VPLLLALVVSLAAANPAAAALTASVEGERLSITATRGADDGVEVLQSSGAEDFVVLGAAAGPGCEDVGMKRATQCSGAAVTELLIDVRDGRDLASADVSVRTTIRGGRGSDELGVPNRGLVDGGRGDDGFDAAGVSTSARTEVRGGPGTDVLGIWVPQGSPFKAGWSVTLRNRAADGPKGELLRPLEGIEGINGSTRRDILVGDRRANRLVGGAASDRMRGRAGPDTIVASGDRARDFVRCGPGVDVVDAGARDRVAADCERVTRRASR